MALDTATINVDPRSNEPASTFVTEIKQYHPSKLALWTQAKYGGERVGPATYNPALAFNPMKTYQLGRPNFFGMFLLVDVGTCSLLNRTDYSKCDGKRTNNLGGALVPGIMQKWEQPNPTTIIMSIRQGVLWPAIAPMTRTDRTVTAEDVKWFFQIEKTEGVYRDTFALIGTMDVVDRFTLKLNFSEPHADFIRMLGNAGLGIISKECYDVKGCLDEKVISPGPYIIDNAAYEPRVKSVINKNPEFYLKGLPYIDRQLGVVIPDVQSQKAAFITGKIDNLATYSPSEKDALLKNAPRTVTQAAICVCGSAHFEMRMDRKPLDDVRVRRAISMGFDRARAWAVAREGFDAMGMPMAYDYLGLELPVSIKEAGQYYQYNPEAAKKLLAEAGYAQGLKIPVWNSWLSYGTPDLIASITADLSKIGVTLDYKSIDTVTGNNMQQGKSWDGFWFSQCYLCSSPDSDSYFLVAYSKSPQNYMGINDPVIDNMYLTARKELDPAKRQLVLWAFTRYMFDQMYGVHFGTPTVYCHFAPWLRNAACHVYGYAGVHNMTGWIMWVEPTDLPK